MSEILTIQRGNPYSATVTVTDSSGNPYDLTDKTLMFTVKTPTDNTDDDSSALITKDITTHGEAVSGISTISLTATDTLIPVGQYKADVRIYSPLGVQLNSETFVANVVKIVTKRTS